MASHGLQIVRRVRDFAQVTEASVVTRQVALGALEFLEIDACGFDKMDRAIRATIMRIWESSSTQSAWPAWEARADSALSLIVPAKIILAKNSARRTDGNPEPYGGEQDAEDYCSTVFFAPDVHHSVEHTD